MLPLDLSSSTPHPSEAGHRRRSRSGLAAGAISQVIPASLPSIPPESLTPASSSTSEGSLSGRMISIVEERSDDSTSSGEKKPLNPCCSSSFGGHALQHTVYNKLLINPLTAKTWDCLRTTRNKPSISFGVVSVLTYDQTMAIFFRKSIEEILRNISMGASDFTAEDIFKNHRQQFISLLEQLKSETSPLVKICLANMRQYAMEFPEGTKFLREVKNILIALANLDISKVKEATAAETVSPLEVLIEIFKMYSKNRYGIALSYLIFGTEENQLEEFLNVLNRWYQVDERRVIDEIEKIICSHLHEYAPNDDHQFKVKDIIDTYVRDGNILPHLVMVNDLPVDLQARTGDVAMRSCAFLARLINQIYLVLDPTQSEEKIAEIVHSCYYNQQLSDPLKTLLGLSSISSRIQAFEYFLKCFPMKEGMEDMAYKQKKGDDRIFFDVRCLPMQCYQPMTILICHKKSRSGYALDEDNPLAEITIGWNSSVFKSSQHLDYYTHSSTLEIINCRILRATKKERKLILDALHLKGEKITSRIKQIVSSPLDPNCYPNLRLNRFLRFR